MPLLASVCKLRTRMMKEKEKTIAIVKVIDPSKLKLVSTHILKFFHCLQMKLAYMLNLKFRVTVGKIRCRHSH